MTINTKPDLLTPEGRACGGQLEDACSGQTKLAPPQVVPSGRTLLEDPQSFPNISMCQTVKLGYGCRLDIVVQASVRYVIQEFLTNVPMAKMYILENFWVENVHIQDKPFDLFDISRGNGKCLRRCIFGAIGTDGIGIGKYCRIRMTGHYTGAIPSPLVNVKSHELIINPRGYVRE
jgi:hypothetical protein